MQERLCNLRCDSETVKDANALHLSGILADLRNQTFFRLVSLNMSVACPLDTVDAPAPPSCSGDNVVTSRIVISTKFYFITDFAHFY